MIRIGEIAVSMVGWCLALLISNGSYAQSKGEVRIAVQPQRGLEYLLDGKERLVNLGLMLPAGPHRFVFYAPDRMLLDTTVMVISDSTIMLRKVLPPTPEYVSFRRSIKRNAQGRFFFRVIPLALTAVTTGFAVAANRDRLEADKALTEAEESYGTLRTPSVISDLKDRKLIQLQTEYDKARSRTIFYTSLATVASIATVIGFIKAASIKDQEYHDLEKVRFDAMAWIDGSDPGCMATITIPLR